MPKIVPIVEGDGEVAAVPNLLTRLLHAQDCYGLSVDHPINANGCDNLTKPGGLERFLNLARLRPECRAVLVLLDADDQCPVKLARSFTERLSRVHITYPVAVVVAKCEYEAWFLASMETIAGRYDALPSNTSYPGDPEAIRGVKEWLSRKFLGTTAYKETTDQAPMTRLIDFELAATRSRSFRRLMHTVEELVAGIDSGALTITPKPSDAA